MDASLEKVRKYHEKQFKLFKQSKMPMLGSGSHTAVPNPTVATQKKHRSSIINPSRKKANNNFRQDISFAFESNINIEDATHDEMMPLVGDHLP